MLLDEGAFSDIFFPWLLGQGLEWYFRVVALVYKLTIATDTAQLLCTELGIHGAFGDGFHAVGMKQNFQNMFTIFQSIHCMKIFCLLKICEQFFSIAL